MNRPVRTHTTSRRNLPLVFILHPVGDNKRLFPYPVDLVTKIEGVELDVYTNTGQSKIIGYEPGYIVTYSYTRKNRVQRNKKPLHSFIYQYNYTISDKRISL